MNTKKIQRVIVIILAFCLVGIASLRIDNEPAQSTLGENQSQMESEEPRSQTSAKTALLDEEVSAPSEVPLPDIRQESWRYQLVNNTHVLSDSFVPAVAETENGQYVDERILEPLQEFMNAARNAGYSVYLSTAYRPISTQRYIFFGKASQIAWGGVEYAQAEMMAREFVAYPGTSEHQLGLSVDLIDSASTVMDAEEIADLPLFAWLKEHCAEYGFIARYPEDKRDITGWYEPWHFRYVGAEAAAYIMENNLCLEEFLELY